MKREGKAVHLRVYIGETDKYDGKPLYEAIMLKAREIGIAGVTVIRGIGGYGANSLIHSSKILRLSEDLPLVLEIVDKEELIEKFLPQLDQMVTEGLIIKKEVNIIAYRHSSER